MGGLFWDLLVVISVTMLLLGPMARGEISPELGAMALALLVASRAIARGRGGWLGRAVRTTFTVGIPLTALLLFVASQGQGDPEKMMLIAGSVGAVLLMLLALYIMIRGLFT